MNKDAIRENAVDDVGFVDISDVFFAIFFQFSCYIGKIRVDKIADYKVAFVFNARFWFSKEEKIRKADSSFFNFLSKA